MPRLDENQMALRWIEHVDGVSVYPKLPVQLKKYHKLWEKNDRIQTAMDKYRKEIAENLERLERFVSNAPPSGEEKDDDEEMPPAPTVTAAARVTYHQRQALHESDQAQAMNARLTTMQMRFTPNQRSYFSRQMLDALTPSSMPMMLSHQLAAINTKYKPKMFV